MPEYLAPGVYVEEVSSGIKPIEGVSTSTVGFLGRTERGPEGANFVTSFAEYQRWYGGFRPSGERMFLPHAVKGFFDNGGRRCFVSRVTQADETLAVGRSGPFTVTAIGRGAWGNGLRVLLHQASSTDPRGQQPAGTKKRYRFSIAYFASPPSDWVNPLAAAADLLQGGKKRPRVDSFEDFDNLTDEPGAPDDVVAVVNASSQLVRLERGMGGVPISGEKSLADAAKVATTWDELGGAAAPGTLALPDFVGSPDPYMGQPWGQNTGLRSLDLVDEVSLLVAPEHVNYPGLDQELVNSCENLKDRVVLLSVREQDQRAINDLHPQIPTSFGALYHPWIKILDPISNAPIDIPPVGHVAGICARTDITRGVHKAPANEAVSGAIDLTVPVNKERQDILNPRNVNCIRDFRADGRGIRVWGARTMSSDPEWRYLNVRRLFLFVEESIDQGTQWVVFEPNVDATWAAVERNITMFLTLVWRSGALMGTTRAEAFFVKCDRETMTQADIDAGRLICLIGIAPAKPAEFVIFRISQKTAMPEAQ